MAKGTPGGSRSPLVIVMLLVAAVALALYFGRDLVSPGEPPATGTESAEQEDTDATPSDSAASADASVDESGSLAEQVAGKIVERLEEGSGDEAQTGGESASAGQASAEGAASGFGEEAVTPDEDQAAADAGDSATTSSADSSTASVDPAADAAPEDQAQASAATGSQGGASDTLEEEVRPSGETGTAMTGAGQETESVAEGQVTADAATLPAEGSEDGAGSVAMTTGAGDSVTTSMANSSTASGDSVTTSMADSSLASGDSVTTSMADSSLASSASAPDAAPEDQMQAGTETAGSAIAAAPGEGMQGATGDTLEEEVRPSGETGTAMTGAGQETESVAEGRLAADAVTLPAEGSEDGAGTLAMAADAGDSATASSADSSTASVDAAADATPEDQAQAGAATGSQGSAGDALEEEVRPSGETETAMTGAGQETESVAEDQVAAGATTLPAEDTEDGAGTGTMAADAGDSVTTSSADSSTASVDSAADVAPEDRMQAGAATGSQGSTGDTLEEEAQPSGETRTAMTGAGQETESVAGDQVAAGATTLPAEDTEDGAGTLAMATDEDESAAASSADSSLASVDSAAESAPEVTTQAGAETTDTADALAPSEEEQLQIAEEVATRVAEKVSDLRPSPDPGTVAKAAAEVAEEFGLDVATLAQAVARAVMEEQAESFVEQIAEPDPQPLEVDDADHFVSPDQMLSLLPDASLEITSREEILSDPELGPDTPITVVREVEEIRIANPEKLIASAGGDLDQEIRVLEGDELRVKTLDEVLAELMESPAEPIAVVSDVKYFEVTTPSEFARQSQVDDDEPLRIIKDRYTLEAASVAELLRQELDLPSDAIFYLRTVRPEDMQGIWGIVQEGLSGNFARGMAIRYGQSISTYQIEIPRYADEILPDNSSSFLGKLIHEKTLDSYVYNFKHHRIGRNPDRIYPGQEIVIINFTPEELVSIFKHFVEQRTASG